LIREPANALERSTRDHARADQYRFAAFEMKDTSFSHEREVRAVIQAVPYDAGTLETARTEIERLDLSLVGLNPDWVLVELAQVLLEEEAIKKQLRVAEALFLPVPGGFITQVSIDPRCSLYKQKHMRSFFEERGIPIASSTCFGYAANAFDVKPRSNVLRSATSLIQ
jgi:hypothetical protein